MVFIAPIVEGHGEVEAVPVLLHRMAVHEGAYAPLRVNAPIRVKCGSFLNDDAYFQKHVALAAAKAAPQAGHVLILLDCDDAKLCPATLGPKLLAKAKEVRSDVGYLVVLAYREFETWFIAAVTSLGGSYGLPLNMAAPEYLEGIRDAKGWLKDRMDCAYDPITHQHRFARSIDLEQARGAPSFDRFYRRFRSIVDATG
jgi:hypothetical protein